MTPGTPREIIEGIHELGSLPQSLSAVLKVVNNPHAGAKEIAEVISRDISLTTRLLKMVNSSHYMRKGRVTKVSEAVIVMGLESIKTLILGSTIFGMTPDEELLKMMDIRRIWRHLLEVAQNARIIAELIGYREPEEAFVTGILHDVGIVILLLHFKKDYAELVAKARRNRQELVVVEQDTLGYNHAEIGAELITAWRLPKSLAYAVRNHHNSEDTSTNPTEEKLCDIVSLADRLAVGSLEIFQTDIARLAREIKSMARNLKLDHTETGKIRRDSLSRSLEMAAYLELDVGDVIEIISDANAYLADLYFGLEQTYLEMQGYYENTEVSRASEKTVTG
nr:HDOD domain-containing protein [candidate division Zixibacteria bacterium]